MSEVVLPDGSTLSYTYDVAGVLSRNVATREGVNDTRFRQTDFAFDNLGRLVVTVQPAPAAGATRPTLTTQYDAAGNVRFTTDPNGSDG